MKNIPSEIEHLDKAIAKAEPIPDNAVAWRLFDSQMIHAHRRRVVGTILMDAGFVDLTFMEDVARKYAQGDFSVLAEVWIPKGTRVLPMFQITESDQGDLLLPRDSHFLVRDMDERKDLLQITLELVG